MRIDRANEGCDEGYIQTLDDSKCAEAKVVSKHGEETIEEGSRPTDLRQNENGNLANYEKAVEDCPECSCGLVWYSAPATL